MPREARIDSRVCSYVLAARICRRLIRSTPGAMKKPIAATMSMNKAVEHPPHEHQITVSRQALEHSAHAVLADVNVPARVRL